MPPFFILIVGIIIGFLLSREFSVQSDSGIGKIARARTNQKEEYKQKMLAYLAQHKKARNNDFEKILGIADSTVTKYLQELENEGKVEQVGGTGAHVYYQLT